MDRNRVQVSLLKLSMVVTALSTWFFCSFIFASRPEEGGENALSSLMRLPASLPAKLPQLERALPGVKFGSAAKISAPIEMNVVKMGCWDRLDDGRAQGQATTARWIRLTGRACLTKSHIDMVTVHNLSNGYAATVFSSRTRDLTTDFIPLRAGRNDLMIRFEQGLGTALETRVSFSRD